MIDDKYKKDPYEFRKFTKDEKADVISAVFLKDGQELTHIFYGKVEYIKPGEEVTGNPEANFKL